MGERTAFLLLEDGSVYAGQACGAFQETVCRWEFCTAMSGQLELLSSPLSAGTGLVFSYPMAGNYGVNRADMESDSVQAAAMIVNELCAAPSNFRSEGTLEAMLVEHGIPCLCDVDTRSLVKRLREKGSMTGMLVEEGFDRKRCMEAIAAAAASFREKQLVASVSTKEALVFSAENTGSSIALLDFGCKKSLREAFTKRGCRVTQYPYNTTAQQLLAGGHDGFVLSDGPGNPALYPEVEVQLAFLLAADKPIFAVDLGHLLLARAAGAKTELLQSGHFGANYPVRFLQEDRSYLTAQSHSYVVSAEDLPAGLTPLCKNVNDKTVEGLTYTGKPALSVQFHPEAAPGPEDTLFLIDQFVSSLAE